MLVPSLFGFGGCKWWKEIREIHLSRPVKICQLFGEPRFFEQRKSQRKVSRKLLHFGAVSLPNKVSPKLHPPCSSCDIFAYSFGHPPPLVLEVMPSGVSVVSARLSNGRCAPWTTVEERADGTPADLMKIALLQEYKARSGSKKWDSSIDFTIDCGVCWT